MLSHFTDKENEKVKSLLKARRLVSETVGIQIPQSCLLTSLLYSFTFSTLPLLIFSR